ncbi:MAG: endonuclease/exonuclease/phosphatase family protein [Prevotella sp.]|nr:endonuclease/exonuclease/phosphatase family protein [Prevotella sp.]
MKKIITIIMLLLLVGAASANAQDKQYQLFGIGFYNLENLFDTCHDEGHNDYEYLPEGRNKWTGLKYTHKLQNMARVLAEMGTDRLPMGCAAIGVSEVENAKCLTDLCNQPPLKERGFQFVHIEGPDQRGVDCALLYNPRLFQVRDTKLVPYIYVKPEDSLRATRGFLTVSGTLAGEHVTIIVNHLPSRGATSYYREEGGRQLYELKQQLMAEDPGVKLLIMGDMNDDPQDKSMAEALGARRKMKLVEDDGLWNPWWDVLASGNGTLPYDGGWNLFDQIILSKSLLDKHMKDNKDVDLKKIDCSTLKYYRHQIFRRDYLFQREGRYKGNTLRTHAGGTWLDGYSDHLPTLVYLVKEKK